MGWQLPSGWADVALATYTQAGLGGRGDALARLYHQVATYGRRPEACLRARYAPPALVALHQTALGFLRTPPVPDAQVLATGRFRLGGCTWQLELPTEEMPLAKWIVLERAFLQQPARLAELEGQHLHLAELVATLAQPVGQAFDPSLVAQHTQQLGALPVPVGVAVLALLREGIAHLRSTYPDLWAASTDPSDRSAATEPLPGAGPAGNAQTRYYQRWGWAALLAELCNGHPTPSLRAEWLQAPVALALQELARRSELARVWQESRPSRG
jgi:hypothetical protein